MALLVNSSLAGFSQAQSASQNASRGNQGDRVAKKMAAAEEAAPKSLHHVGSRSYARNSAQQQTILHLTSYNQNGDENNPAVTGTARGQLVDVLI